MRDSQLLHISTLSPRVRFLCSQLFSLEWCADCSLADSAWIRLSGGGGAGRAVVRELDCRLHLSTVMDYLPAMLDSADADFAVSALARYLADVALVRCDAMT